MKRIARDIFDVLGWACILHTIVLYRLGFEGFSNALNRLAAWVLSWRNLFLDLPLLGTVFLLGLVAMNLPLNRRTRLKTMPIVRYAKLRRARKDSKARVKSAQGIHAS